MESLKTRAKSFRFHDPRQERIYRRLILIGPGPASFFRDACQIASGERPFDTSTHLVGHLLREIESALRDVLEVFTDRSERIKNGKEKHKAEIKSILHALNISEEDSVAQAWLRMAIEGDNWAFHMRAHRNSLAPPRSIDKDFRDWWNDIQKVFDAILERFESHYLKFYQVLDDLIKIESPARKDAEQLRLHIPNNFISYNYFFEKISPQWLEVLKDEGFFKNPPEPDYNDERGTIGFPVWPESRCLVRMAKISPEVVLNIVTQIPDTDNVQVREDLINIACALPPELAKQITEKESTWINSQRHLFFLFPNKVAGLINHLTNGGQEAAALNLARVLLKLMPDPRSKDEYSFGPEPEALFDNHHYTEIVKQIAPVLAKIGEHALSLFCDLLEEAVNLSRKAQGGKTAEDFSYIWRPAIEDHIQNHIRKPKEILVSAVRDVAESMMERKGKQVLDIIESKPFNIFKRIGLHLRRKWLEVDPDGTAKRITDHNFFDNNDMHHEIFHLLHTHFDKFPSEVQKAYLDQVAQGFKPKSDFLEELSGHKESKEERDRHIRHWKYAKLWPIKNLLSDTWKKQFVEYKLEFGPLKTPDFLYCSYGATWIGPTSPKSFEELGSMSIEELITYLKEWQPSEESMGCSTEGLGRGLADRIAAEPERFASTAEQFIDLEPNYVRAFLTGLRDATRNNSAFPWSSVLKLCQWVVDQPREIPGRGGPYKELDPGWVWARKTIASLLSEGFKFKSGGIPLDERNRVWKIIRSLTDDPDPSLEYEKTFEESFNPADMAINTTRGEAMHAAIDYALWVNRHTLKVHGPGERKRSAGFGEMPEVQEVLDIHLNLVKESTLTIRSIYGQRLPDLVFIDSSWAAKNVKNIFPQEEELLKFRYTAWETYIVFCRPFDDVFNFLNEEYRFAVEHIGTLPIGKWHMANPDECLAEHLMTFYIRGKFSLEDSEGLVTRFYEKASNQLRAHAMKFIGEILCNSHHIPDQKIIERLQMLWLCRLRSIKESTNPELYGEELKSFGWWLISGKFDKLWALSQLKEALRITGKIDPDHLVIEHLATHASAEPAAAIDCLSLIVGGDEERWVVSDNDEHVRTIILTGLQHTEENSRQKAKDLVNQLSARGYLSYRSLL